MENKEMTDQKKKLKLIGNVFNLEIMGEENIGYWHLLNQYVLFKDLLESI